MRHSSPPSASPISSVSPVRLQLRSRHRRRHHRPPSSVQSRSSQSPSPSNATEESPLASFTALSSSSKPPILISVSVPLPVFHGLPGECPAAHLSHFSRLFRSDNSDLSLNFPVSLLGDAALWYELTVEPDPSICWEDIKAAFLRAFRRPESPRTARADLISLQQRDGESAIFFYLRMQRILKRWPDHGLPEALVRDLFVDGLRDELQEWVAPRRPETAADAVGMAMDWESAMTGRKCGFCEEGGHGEADCEARKVMREEWMRRRDKTPPPPSPAVAAEKERIGSIGMRSQCQCGKYWCCKKYERGGSTLTERDVITGGECDGAGTRPLELE